MYRTLYKVQSDIIHHSQQFTVTMNTCIILLVTITLAAAAFPEDCPARACTAQACVAPEYRGSDANGCPTCSCCSGMMCNMYCEKGFVKNEQGCPTCFCNQ